MPATPNLVHTADQTEWKDRGSGYRRRIVSPPTPGLRGELVEVHMPAGAPPRFQSTGRRGARYLVAIVHP